MKNLIRTRFEELARDDDAQRREAELQALSIRLPRGHVALIDHMAKELEYNRQQFLARVLDLALNDCMMAFADMYPEEKRQEIYQQLADIRDERPQA